MNKSLIILLLILLTGCLTLLKAQALDEDQQMMRQYVLPEQAVPESDLIVKDSLLTLDTKPYTGTAYTRFPNGQLQSVTQYVNGYKQGTLLVWYPDGRPQLMSNYKKNHLNGRFKGWYQFGGVIYDLVMKDNAYQGDQMVDSDTARETSAGQDDAGQGDGKDQSND